MSENKDLNHLDEQGRPRMVDVSAKAESSRLAVAAGSISLQAETTVLIRDDRIKKGNVLSCAELAGIMAVKKTSDIIPLCHPLLLSGISIKCELTDESVDVTAEVKCQGQTGVEMEALTAVSAALLTVYDMCKAVDKKMCLNDIHLVKKTKEEIS